MLFRSKPERSHTKPEPREASIARRAVDRQGGSVMLSHDAGHLTHEVFADLELYAPLVTRGCYCVVEDTNIQGNPLGHEGVLGPLTAVQEFLNSHPEFEVDESCERFQVTFNPGGWLRRV